MELNGNLKIAVQRKGRLAQGSLDLLKQAGLQFETYENRLFSRCRNLPVDILYIRDDDIPEYVQDQVADLGIVGNNVLQEKQSNVDSLINLDFGFCSLCLAAPESSDITNSKDLAGKKIATSYPVTLRNYLKQKNIPAEIIELRGCVEIAPALKVADAICDLVSTGSTLRTNRLKQIDTVEKSQAVLIGSKNAKKDFKPLIDKLILRMKAVQEAKVFKYIMFYLPKGNLTKIINLVPGLSSPTVLPLFKPEMVAVHSVVEEERFWETVEQIKNCGGSGILVTPIEKFIR